MQKTNADRVSMMGVRHPVGGGMNDLFILCKSSALNEPKRLQSIQRNYAPK